MNHEMYDAAFIQRTKCGGLHAEKGDVVRKKISSAGEEECSTTSKNQSQGSEQKQRAAITKDRAKESAVRGMHGSVPRIQT